MNRKILSLGLLVILVVFSGAGCSVSAPRNVILFIGDGMGFEQVKAAGMYANGAAGTLCFESFPYSGQVTTYSADKPITDSAAAGTAIATGVKVNNGVISIATPGDSRELVTMLEHFQSKGKMVGLVSTAYITHATPAAFGAHEPSRKKYGNIAADYLNQSKPNILFGGAKYMTVSAAKAAGYTVVTDRASLVEMNTDDATHISGQFGNNHLPYEYDGLGALPHLSEMTYVAMNVLDNDPDGFFLMVEGGRIDHAGHDSKTARNVPETVEFARAVQEALDWAKGRDDTLIIVTADHETGGMKVLQNKGKGVLPDVNWTGSGKHTNANVPVYSWGASAEGLDPVMNNTNFFMFVTGISPVSRLSD